MSFANERTDFNMESKMTDSQFVEIMEYSFLVVFANDGHLDDAELAMLERLALRDGEVDDKEREVLRNIFERARKKGVSDQVDAEIQHFCARYDI